MQAVVVENYDSIDNVRLKQVPLPEVSAGHVRVRIQAASVGFVDGLKVQGLYQTKDGLPFTPGSEFAGVVDEAAADVPGLTPGMPVMGVARSGALAEFVAVPAAALQVMPEGIAPEVGASFRTNYLTSLYALRERGTLRMDEYLLVLGAAGGVGIAAVQIGKLLGVEMYGTASSDEKLAHATELGLQHAINYKKNNYEEAIRDLTHGEGVDAVFEMLGGEHTNKSARCLRDFGRVIVYGSATGEKSLLDTRLLYAKGGSVHGLWLTYLSANRELMSEAWKQLAAWTAEGHLRPVIGSVFPMEKAADAYRLLSDGKSFGKLILRIP